AVQKVKAVSFLFGYLMESWCRLCDSQRVRRPFWTASNSGRNVAISTMITHRNAQIGTSLQCLLWFSLMHRGISDKGSDPA
ncbi:MAG: hypothetical protein LBQ84_07465, partial [Flavobacteriaceae bacterium]|nr:hypothetical protein [Flavobacteriaceae bacterium]